MYRFIFFVNIIVVGILLSSCVSSPSPVLPPAKLTAIKAEFGFTEHWYTQIDDGVSDRYYLLHPVFYKEILYSIDYLGNLTALNKNTADVLWVKKLNLPISAGLVRMDNLLIAATRDGEVLALELSTGEQVWKVQVSSEVIAKPIQAGKFVIVKSVDGKIKALDLKTGANKWIYDRPVPALTLRGGSSPVAYGSIILAGLDNGKLVGLSLETGQEVWSLAVANPKGRTEIERMVDIDATPVLNGENLYVVTYQGKVTNLHLPSGKIIWNRDFSSYSGISFDSNKVFISDSDGYLWALDQRTGATLWKQDKLVRRSLTMPVVYENSVVVADFNGFVHWLDVDDGHIKARFRIGGDGYDKETEDDFIFSKSSNILIAPIVNGGDLFIFDRYGSAARITILKQ